MKIRKCIVEDIGSPKLSKTYYFDEEVISLEKFRKLSVSQKAEYAFNPHGPSIIQQDGWKWWINYGTLHREDGPAILHDGIPFVTYWLNGERLDFQEWLQRTPLSLEEKIELKLKYGICNEDS